MNVIVFVVVGCR